MGRGFISGGKGGGTTGGIQTTEKKIAKELSKLGSLLQTPYANHFSAVFSQGSGIKRPSARRPSTSSRLLHVSGRPGHRGCKHACTEGNPGHVILKTHRGQLIIEEENLQRQVRLGRGRWGRGSLVAGPRFLPSAAVQSLVKGSFRPGDEPAGACATPSLVGGNLAIQAHTHPPTTGYLPASRKLRRLTG